ncbi:MAG: zinc-binding metallopeptidase family protein [Acidiferrobacterales bacterium]
MIHFTCECSNSVYFENSVCLNCGRMLGFLPDANMISALEPEDDSVFRALANDRLYRACRNYTEYEVCNWMVPVEEHKAYCESCRLNEVIPNLSEPQNIKLWYRIEKAKRRLLYTLKRVRLPIEGRDVDPVAGLSFRFMANESESAEFDDEYSPGARIMTGHSTGTITINLAEADPSAREEIREKMNERYRTLLGHFRHESGHFYWDKLVKDSEWIDEYRSLFGDETRNYSAALDTYYKNGPPVNWEQQWISAYASAHPWEDFAESWAHYLHMVDTLETAHDYDFSLQGLVPTGKTGDMQFGSGYMNNLSDLFDDWKRLTSALNAMSRSMGVSDMYPFVLTATVKSKLEMIHRLVSSSRT